MPEEEKSKHEASGMTDAQDKLESSKTHARKAAEIEVRGRRDGGRISRQGRGRLGRCA